MSASYPHEAGPYSLISPYTARAMVKYNSCFEFDPAKHKGFSRATRRVWDTAKGGPAPTIGREQEALLRLGLSAFDMDFKVCPTPSRTTRARLTACSCPQWMGNLTDSKANASHNEVVIRLYRSWTGKLVFEARYRPVSLGGLPTMYEFAYESDKEVYNSGGTFADELRSYDSVLKHSILDVIMAKIKDPDYPYGKKH